MESEPLTYIPQKSKKRVFPGGTSSYVDPDVVEITPPITWSAKSSSRSRSRSLKQKEVIQHEIIDVDMDDDCGEVMLVGEKINSNNKGKEAMVQSAAQKGSADGVDSLMKNSAQGLDSFGSDFSFNNDYMDIYYDDFVFDDDYTMLQSQYDKIDIPSGVEAPIPWLPQNASTPATEPLAQLVSSSSRSRINPNSGLVSEFAQGKKLNGGSNYNPTYSSSSVSKPSIPSANSESLHGIWKSEVSSSNTNNSSVYPLMPHPTSMYNKNRKHAGSITSPYSTSHYIPMNTGFNFSTSAKTPSIPNYEQNLASTVPNYLDYLEGSPFPSVHYPFPTKARTTKGLQDLSGNVYKYGNEEEILKKFQGFKKFDTVEDHSDHHYVKTNLSSKPQSKNWAKKIQDEWRILEKDLPDTIFVRVYESRMDLLRAVIIGAEGTPYHDGLFFFDVFFPSSYPSVPPHVHYHSGGLRINPNLYNQGKVCLSLLNTWSGGQKEKWLPGVSTMLQVLVSIQGLILNAKPYFNEPGFAHSSGSPAGEQSAAKYNEDTLIKSLTTMVYSIRRPPKYFEDLVAGHFLTRGHDILVACKAYMDGAQVGCLVRGGVQDVDEGDKSCSREFKQTLSNQISIIVGAFKNIGLKNCDKFLPPSIK